VFVCVHGIDQQVWSKLDSGRLPSLGEVRELVEPTPTSTISWPAFCRNVSYSRYV